MAIKIKKWINVHHDEAGLFFRVVVLIFLIRCAGIIFNNFTETVFLKRFGVEFLPVLYIVNPLVTLVIMGKLSGLSPNISAFHRLQAVLTGCAVVIIFLWGLISLWGI